MFAKEFASVKIFFKIAWRWLSAATALGSVGLLRDFDVLISVALNFGVIGRTGWAFSLQPVWRLLLEAGVITAAPLPPGFRIDLEGLLLHLYCSSFSLSCSCSKSAEVLFRMEELILAWEKQAAVFLNHVDGAFIIAQSRGLWRRGDTLVAGMVAGWRRESEVFLHGWSLGVATCNGIFMVEKRPDA